MTMLVNADIIMQAVEWRQERGCSCTWSSRHQLMSPINMEFYWHSLARQDSALSIFTTVADLGSFDNTVQSKICYLNIHENQDQRTFLMQLSMSKAHTLLINTYEYDSSQLWKHIWAQYFTQNISKHHSHVSFQDWNMFCEESSNETKTVCLHNFSFSCTNFPLIYNSSSHQEYYQSYIHIFMPSYCWHTWTHKSCTHSKLLGASDFVHHLVL
jgi:hypothetical protein